jgi:hypothetical protein
MIDRIQIEKDLRNDVEKTSASNEYIVYISSDVDSLITFKGDLDSAIQNFLSQIDDDGVIKDTNFFYVNISSIEEFNETLHKP